MERKHKVLLIANANNPKENKELASKMLEWEDLENAEIVTLDELISDDFHKMIENVNIACSECSSYYFHDSGLECAFYSMMSAHCYNLGMDEIEEFCFECSNNGGWWGSSHNDPADDEYHICEECKCYVDRSDEDFYLN